MKKILILIFALIAYLSVYGSRVVFSQPGGINPGNIFPSLVVPINHFNAPRFPYFVVRPCIPAVCPGVTTGRTTLVEIRNPTKCQIEVASGKRPLSKECELTNNLNSITTNTQRSLSNATVLNKSNTLPKGSFGGKTVKLNKFFTLSLTGMDPKIRKMLNSSEVQVSRAMRGKKRTRLVYYLTIR
jgi:hypothetical protein